VRALRAIAGRETAAFFHSAMAPVVVTGFLLLAGFAFVNVILDYAEISQSALASGRQVAGTLNLSEGVFLPLATNLAVFLVFFMPAVTMRLFSEEYRSGRYGLVTTYPVADHVWVLGKFTAALGVGLVLVAGTGVYFAVTGILGHPEAGPLVSTCLGLVLAVALMSAWGVFFSTLLPYQVVAYILGFAFLMFLTTVANLEPHLPASLAPLTERLSLSVHFLRFARGLIDTRDLVYFAGWIVLGLAAATASLAGRRLAGGRRLGRWAPVLVLALLLLVLDAIAVRAPHSLDLTRNKRYSLAPQTARVLDALDVDVRITAFYQRLDPRRKTAEVMLASFRDRSDRVSYEVVNPDVELTRVQEMGVTTARAVVVEGGGRRRELLDPDESTLINAVFRVMIGHRPIVYHLQGHGEHRLDDEERNGFAALDGVLERQGYDLRPLLLSDAPEVPADAQIVLVAAPRLEFAAPELSALHAFVARGGALLLLLDPGTPLGVNDWVSRYNVVPSDDFLVTASRANATLRVDERVMVLFDYPEHEITRGLPGMATFFPFAQSLLPRAEAIAGVEARTILRSDERSWAEHDLDSLVDGEIGYDEDTDRPGPLPFGVALEVHRDEYFEPGRLGALGLDEDDLLRQNELLATLRQWREDSQAPLPPSIFNEAATSRLVVVGDADFAVNANLNLYGNRDLLLNMMGWLAREQVLIAERARDDRTEPLVLSGQARDLLGWTCAVAWPALAGLIALVVVLRRRRFH